MNKNILAIAIAAAVAAPSAFAAATVYGVAHMSVDSVSNVKTTSTAANANDNFGQVNVASNSSRIGIKGSEDLGSGLKAVYQYETTIGFDGDTNGGTGGFGTQRNTFVGLGGGFGTVLLGIHDTPLKMVGRKYDMFGDQTGNNRVMMGSGNTHLVDGRHNNVIAYVSPVFSGFQATLAYVPGANNASTGDENFDSAANKVNAWSANAMYTAGAFDAGLGYINASNVVAGNKDYSAYRLGAGYSFGAVRVNGLYQNAKQLTDNSDRGAYGIGATYKVTAAGTIKGQYMMAEDAKGTKNGANSITVGYDHAMSKNTTVYALYAAVNNNADGTFSVMQSNAGTNDNTFAVTGKDNSAFSVGVQHKF